MDEGCKTGIMGLFFGYKLWYLFSPLEKKICSMEKNGTITKKAFEKCSKRDFPDVVFQVRPISKQCEFSQNYQFLPTN